MPYIYSSASAGQNYVTEIGPILIDGGANVLNKKLWTPAGVRTEVNKEQIAALLKHPTFKSQLDNGYLHIDDEKDDADEVADKHNLKKDNSAQRSKKELTK